MSESISYIVSAVIVSYSTRELTLHCLANLYTDLGEMSAEVFVVDNGSADDSVSAVRAAFPQVVVIDVGHNAGFGSANNLAIARAAGEFILLLNTDAFVRPGVVGRLVAYLRDHPRTAVVGPRLLNEDGSLQRSCYKFPSPGRAVCEHTLLTAAFPNHSRLGDYRAWAHDAERRIDGFVIGACMLVRRTAIEQVGGFDERFFMYFEETDWCRRFRSAGWEVSFTPAAQVTHMNGGSGKGQPERVFDAFYRSAEKYVRKHHGVSGLAVYRASLMAGAVVRAAAFGARSLAPGRSPESATTDRRLVRKWCRIFAWHAGLGGWSKPT